MIPLRLVLENFMCYREKTEIDFRGSTIWALCGHNGSGKSTIFDAMRYVLYGEHRAGKQKIEALIHRSTTPASSFLIEFDFAIGDNEYRVQRTYSQKKKGTMQALYLAGPDAPTLGRPGPQFIPDTETKDGFDRWVLKTIGLDERAFTVSVLLLQGQSDKLLKLGGPEQHEVLTHIIDLSHYDSLAKRALEKQKAQDTAAKVHKGQLDGLEEINETSITAAEQRVCDAQEEKERARKHQLTLTTLKEQARSWQQLQEKEKHLHQELTRFERLLEQSEQIERNAARLAILQQIIQPLTQIQQKQVDSRRFQQNIEQDQKRVTALETKIKRVLEELQEVQQQLEAARACSQQRDREYKAVQAELLALQIPCNDIARLQEKQQAYHELVNNLSTFAPDLERQQQHLSDRLDEIGSIEKATPLLKRFADFRREWQQATQDLDRISQELRTQTIAQEQTNTQIQALDKTREEMRERASQLQSEVASQRALLTECQKRFDRFHTIEGGATCSYCGQPLTAEHLEAERQRINVDLQERKYCLELCITGYNKALQQQKDMDRDIQQAKQKEHQELRVCEQLTRQQNTVLRKRDTAYIEAKNQLELLAPAYLKQIQGIAITSIDVEVCFQATYPTPQDLAALSLQLREKPALAKKLQAVEEALAQQQELRRKQEHILSEIKPLLQTYPPERARSLLKNREQAHQKEADLIDTLQRLSIEIEQREQQVSSFVDEEQKAREEQSRLKQALGIAWTNLNNAQQAITEIQEQLPHEWLVHIPHISPEMLAGWQQEIRGLQGATEKLQALIDARQYQSRDKQALVELENEQCQIPEEARRMPEQVQEEIDQTNTLYQEFEKLERRSIAEVQQLKGIRESRRKLQQQWAEATRLGSRYKELAHLLGREGLQHYLLQNAEAGIVYHANEILDRISGGTLRLELRPGSENRTKALDMVVYNSAISAHESQSIDLLSGSQQFRVAISLAIGIGQYIGNTSHRVESIMIDEGFGSLDVGSRDEMTQALQALEDDFKRVIVVSHQNEFSDKFPNRYEAALVDGCTRITLG
jgi:exonuclease SbcC